MSEHDDELDPLTLDRRLREAAGVWTRWRRELRRARAFDGDPLATYRGITSRTAFTNATDALGKDPLASELRRWIYRLAEQRINAAAITQVEYELRARGYVIDRPEHTLLPLRDMLKAGLSDSARRAAWLDAFSEHASELSAYTAALWERRAELARRMRLTSPDEIELCSAGIGKVAENWLALTDDMAGLLRERDLAQWLERALGLDLNEGWPARLGLRPLADLFRETRILDSLPLEPGPFPEPIAGSSFLRGFLRLGAAFATASAPRHQPFVIAHDAYGLRERTFGALFGLVACSPEFAERALGLTRSRRKERSRAAARVTLSYVRSAALRVLLRGPALSGRKAFMSAFEAQTERVHGLGLRADLAGALFRLNPDDSQRFAGLLLAAGKNLELTQEHDADWYRNPRASEQLRAEAELSPATTCAEDRLEADGRVLARLLAEAVD